MTTRVEEIEARLEACKGKPNESRAYAAFIGGVDGPSMDGSDGDVAYLLAEVKRLEGERDVAHKLSLLRLDACEAAEDREMENAALALSLAEALERAGSELEGGDETFWQQYKSALASPALARIRGKE